jgi:DNA-binding NarL/FixJ family response regulator
MSKSWGGRNAEMKKIRIVIAEDQMLTREGLKMILDLEEDMEVVGAAKNGLEACELTEKLQPDLVLMDIQMPIMNGIAAIKYIKAKFPGIHILVLTTFMEEEYIVDGLANGADGYVMKDMDTDKMIALIHDVMEGQIVLPGPVAAKLANRLIQMRSEYEQAIKVTSNKLDEIKLTDREKEISKLMIQGLSNREIAQALYITEGTARNYISNLYMKLDVNDRAQAISRLFSLL